MNYSQADIRQINRENVLTLIGEHGSISRRDICTLLGSSMTTVLKITDYLEGKGLVSVSVEEKSGRGRHPEIVSLIPQSMLTLAIDYDGRKTDIALCDYYGRVLDISSVPATRDIVIFFQDTLPSSIERFLRNRKESCNRILGIGLCLPGNFSKTGKYNIGPLPQFLNSDKFEDNLSVFRSRMGFPVYCCNDANASAYGEFISRRNDGLRDLVFLYAGMGLGAGLILDSRLRLGEHNMAGEVGFTSFDADYVTDKRKPGWLENCLSRTSLYNQFPGFSDNVVSAELVDYVARVLALVVSNLSCALDVTEFVVDGELVRALDSYGLRDRIRYYSSKLSLINVFIEKPTCRYPSLSGLGKLVIDECLSDLLKD